MKFWVNEDDVNFNVCKSTKHLCDIHVISTNDVIDEAVDSVSHLKSYLLIVMGLTFKVMKRKWTLYQV